jgi:hypothetical protein
MVLLNFVSILVQIFKGFTSFIDLLDIVVMGNFLVNTWNCCIQGYFHSLPGVRECPANQNPASYMLEITGAGIGHTAARDFSLDYERSSLARKNCKDIFSKASSISERLSE